MLLDDNNLSLENTFKARVYGLNKYGSEPDFAKYRQEFAKDKSSKVLPYPVYAPELRVERRAS